MNRLGINENMKIWREEQTKDEKIIDWIREYKDCINKPEHSWAELTNIKNILYCMNLKK